MEKPLAVPDGTWQVYLVRTGQGALYTGISTDPRRRLAEHTQGRRGARSLRGKGPLQLVFIHAATSRGEAARLEARIKRLRKAQKEALVAGLWCLPDAPG